MQLICCLLFLIFPILSIPIILIIYLFDNKKKGLVYSLLLGLSIGCIVYYFIPTQNYDLYRHHLVVINLFDTNITGLLNFIKNSNKELFVIIISYFVAVFKNVDLLQFIVVSLGYSILFYILYNYRKHVNCSILVFFIIFIFTIFGFNVLYFISGLWFYISVILFFLAFYMEKITKTNKIICYAIYFSTILFHNAFIFPIIILFIYKFFKEKINIKIIIICLLIVLLPTYILHFINSLFEIKIFSVIVKMYDAYLEQNNSMKQFYDGSIFVIEISKLLITLAAIFLNKNESKTTDTNGFIILLSLCTVLMMSKSIVMIRFIMIIQFIGIIPLMNYLTRINKNKLLFILTIVLLDIFYLYFFYKQFSYQSFGNLNNSITKNIISIFNKN